ncbi:MAG: hypothetical protein ACRD26_21860 [Vicinamibacterales bacterium]
MFNHRRNRLMFVGAFVVVLTLPNVAQAGPPLICHPFDAGTAALLPWGTGQGWNTPDRSYDVPRLTADTLRLLDAETPVLARMENLRRATIYAFHNQRVAAELLAAVLGKALTAAARGTRDPLAWFDAGYLVESYRQGSMVARWDMLTRLDRSSSRRLEDLPVLDGYSFVMKALALAGSDPEMEFAASLMR